MHNLSTIMIWSQMMTDAYSFYDVSSCSYPFSPCFCSYDLSYFYVSSYCQSRFGFFSFFHTLQSHLLIFAFFDLRNQHLHDLITTIFRSTLTGKMTLFATVIAPFTTVTAIFTLNLFFSCYRPAIRPSWPFPWHHSCWGWVTESVGTCGWPLQHLLQARTRQMRNCTRHFCSSWLTVIWWCRTWQRAGWVLLSGLLILPTCSSCLYCSIKVGYKHLVLLGSLLRSRSFSAWAFWTMGTHSLYINDINIQLLNILQPEFIHGQI